MKYFVVLSLLLFSNGSYGTDVMTDDQQQRQSRDFANSHYREISSLYANDELRDREEEAIIALKRNCLKEGNDPSVLRLIGLLYEEKHDYIRANEYLHSALDNFKLVFGERGISHHSIFREIERVEANID